jgi:tRNA U34 5-carboxymethylaminomethyl modifying enzyme MnmG/GidA
MFTLVQSIELVRQDNADFRLTPMSFEIGSCV